MSDKFEITEGTAAQMRALGLSDEQIQSLRDGSFMNRPSERDQLLTQLAQERARNAALEKERDEARKSSKDALTVGSVFYSLTKKLVEEGECYCCNEGVAVKEPCAWCVAKAFIKEHQDSLLVRTYLTELGKARTALADITKQRDTLVRIAEQQEDRITAAEQSRDGAQAQAAARQIELNERGILLDSWRRQYWTLEAQADALRKELIITCKQRDSAAFEHEAIRNALEQQLEAAERQLAEALAHATTAQIHRDEAQARENVSSSRSGKRYFKMVDERDALRKRVEELEAACSAVFATDQPWPFMDAMATMRAAVVHLLDFHDCDTHGYETFRRALNEITDAMPRLRTLHAAVENGQAAMLRVQLRDVEEQP